VPHPVPRQVRAHGAPSESLHLRAEPTKPLCLPALALHPFPLFHHSVCASAPPPICAPRRMPWPLAERGLLWLALHFKWGRTQASCPGLGTEKALAWRGDGNWDRRGDEVCSLAILSVIRWFCLLLLFRDGRLYSRSRSLPGSIEQRQPSPRRTPWRFTSTTPSLLCTGCSSTT